MCLHHAQCCATYCEILESIKMTHSHNNFACTACIAIDYRGPSAFHDMWCMA